MAGMKRVAIIGAGIGGMAAAYDLARAGCQVTIYVGSDSVGGLAGGFKKENWDWSVEKFYHHWFATDRYILQLIDELGWREKVIFPRPYTVMYHAGKFYPFDSIKAALLFPGLGWGLDKLRFGLVGLYLRLTNNWQPLEAYTVDAWLRRWAGDHVYELMWEPLMVGKFGQHYKEVNMAWMWARLFAPTDEAFAKLPAGQLDDLLKPENKAKLQAILKYHVVAGKVMASDVVNLTSADSAQGSPISISVVDGQVKLNDSATVVTTDIETANGVIHVIDAVILPSQ